MFQSEEKLRFYRRKFRTRSTKPVLMTETSAVVLFGFGVVSDLPSRENRVFGYVEYNGGDCTRARCGGRKWANRLGHTAL